MTLKDFTPLEEKPDRTRLYLSIGVVAALALIAILIVILLRAFQGETEPALRLQPAAAPLHDLPPILVTTNDWPRGEEVTICLARPDQAACSPENIIAVEKVDRSGSVEISADVASWLAAGQTRFIVQGKPSGQTISKLFRVLQDPAVLPATATPTPTPDPNRTPSVTITPTATVALSPTLPAPVDGWRAEYYANMNLQGDPIVLRTDPNLAFDWGTGSPDPALPHDRFSARWTRRVSFEGRRYRFDIRADDGVRLFIDGRLVLDEWRDLMLDPNHSIEIDMLPGEHEVRLEYFENTGNALISLSWQVSENYPHWRGEYFTNADLQGIPTLIRNDLDIAFDWGSSSPAPGVIDSDGFSVRWRRSVQFEEGLYRFTILADDGARLLIDNQLVLDRWEGPGAQPAIIDWPLGVGQHFIQLEYHEIVGDAQVSLSWQPAPVEQPTPTATPSPTATATPTGTSTPTPTPTETPSAEPTATPTATPTPLILGTTLQPTQGWAGTVITATSRGWPAGIQVSVALLELGTEIGQAQNISGANLIVPDDGNVTIVFTFPDDDRWLSQPQVQVILHDQIWRVRGPAVFQLVRP